MRQPAQGSRTVTAAMAASAVIFAVPATAAVVSGSDGPRGAGLLRRREADQASHQRRHARQSGLHRLSPGDRQGRRC